VLNDSVGHSDSLTIDMGLVAGAGRSAYSTTSEK